MPDAIKSTAFFSILTLKKGDIKNIPKILLIGGIHGDEATGIGALWHLAESVDSSLTNFSITVIPCANRQAARASSRLLPLEGVDLNRVFPGRVDGYRSERIAYELMKIANEHDVIIDVHTAGHCMPFVLIDHYIDEDKLRIAMHTAIASGFLTIKEMPSELAAIQSLDRSLSASLVRAGKIAFTCELPGFHDLYSKQAAMGAEALIKMVKTVNNIWSRPPTETGILGAISAASRLEMFSSSVGYFEVVNEPGVHIVKNDLIGRVRDESGAILEEFRAPAAAVIIAVQPIAPVDVGSWVSTVVLNG
jgi:N-alpha-acetyl-L-2,4-diaminobutyrate deacetylase